MRMQKTEYVSTDEVFEKLVTNWEIILTIMKRQLPCPGQILKRGGWKVPYSQDRVNSRGKEKKKKRNLFCRIE